MRGLSLICFTFTQVAEFHGFYFPIVIDLLVAMKYAFVILMIILIFLPVPVRAQEEAVVTISSPGEGQIVQGSVEILGSVTVLGFSSYVLSFAYADDPTQTWFVIASSSLPVFEGELGTWDTTILTDGDYTLRLQVFLLDGSVQETAVTGLRVRNYTAIPTATPTATATAIVLFVPPTAQLIAPMPATVTPSLPTPTPLPRNPASLQEVSISTALGRGAFLVLLLFAGFGLLLRLRRE